MARIYGSKQLRSGAWVGGSTEVNNVGQAWNLWVLYCIVNDPKGSFIGAVAAVAGGIIAHYHPVFGLDFFWSLVVSTFSLLIVYWVLAFMFRRKPARA